MTGPRPNGWRNIAVLEGFLDDTPRERRRRQRLETAAPPATQTKLEPPPPPPPLTGNRIQDITLLNDFLEKSCVCRECDGGMGRLRSDWRL